MPLAPPVISATLPASLMVTSFLGRDDDSRVGRGLRLAVEGEKGMPSCFLRLVLIAWAPPATVSPDHTTRRRETMGDKRTGPMLELAHTAMSEEEASRFLDGHRISLGPRTMDPKAQIVGEFVKSIRVPGYYPPVAELRQQLRTMVAIMDEPAPALARIEDIGIPGPAGIIGARVYSSAASTAPARPVVAYFHGGGWVQGDLETHHGLCARLAERADAIVVAVDYRLAPEHKFPAAVDDCLAAYRWLRSRATELGGDVG